VQQVSTFIPYRDRPALDKGAQISWTELESGMLFEPLTGAPTLRRVRGIPQFIWYGEFRSPSYMIGSEDEMDGRPCGGVIGVGDEKYTRSYLPDGRPVYRSDAAFTLDDDATIERLRGEFTDLVAELRSDPDASAERLRVAEANLARLDER
jgi:hypothetical protein